MDQIILHPVKKIGGEILIPGSKSISNRALLLAAVSKGNTSLNNILKSEDTDVMIRALRQLGISITRKEDLPACEVSGIGGKFKVPVDRKFNLGNAGTAIRPLTAMLALLPGEFEIDGDQYMRERPIKHLIEALITLGAKVRYLSKIGCPPFKILGGNTNGGIVSVQGSVSSQYLTSLLMALPLATADSVIKVQGDLVSKPYIDITLNLIKKFGGEIENDNYRTFFVKGNQNFVSPGNHLIEGDASSASYFFGAAAIKNGKVRVNGLGENSVQGDYKFLDVIESMGAKVYRSDTWTEVTGNSLRGVDVDLNHIPDAAMTIATMALFAKGSTKIRNVYNWRVKETDRMHAMKEGLSKLGAKVTTTRDSIQIDPPEKLANAEIETYGDHRVAMSFSLAALGSATIKIKDPDCTRKTFPDYFKSFAAISEF